MALAAPARREVLPAAGVAPGHVLDLAVVPTVRDRRGYRCLELDVLDARVAARAAPAALLPAVFAV